MEYEKVTSPKKQTCLCNNLFLAQYYNGKEENICTSAIPHISKEPHECGKLSEVQIFLVQVTVKKMASGSLFFTKSAILPIFDPILQREGKKIYTSAIPHISKEPHKCSKLSGVQIFFFFSRCNIGLKNG